MANGRVRKAAVDYGAKRGERAQRDRKQTSSGEGAASALESWREIERSRSECEPADDRVLPAPGDAGSRRGLPRP